MRSGHFFRLILKLLPLYISKSVFHYGNSNDIESINLEVVDIRNYCKEQNFPLLSIKKGNAHIFRAS